MLRLDNLSKRYGDYLVFQGLAHCFTPGCVALCEEGSTGESTLLNIIAEAFAPDSGDVWKDGHFLTHAPQQAKVRLAYVPDNRLVFPAQTGRGLLEQVAAEKNVALDEATLELTYGLGLESHLDRRFEEMVSAYNSSEIEV